MKWKSTIFGFLGNYLKVVEHIKNRKRSFIRPDYNYDHDC